MVCHLLKQDHRKSCWERFCHARSREVKVIIKPTKHHLPQIHQNPQPTTSPNTISLPCNPPNFSGPTKGEQWGDAKEPGHWKSFRAREAQVWKLPTFQLFPKTAVNFYGGLPANKSFRGVNRFQSGLPGGSGSVLVEGLLRLAIGKGDFCQGNTPSAGRFALFFFFSKAK